MRNITFALNVMIFCSGGSLCASEAIALLSLSDGTSYVNCTVAQVEPDGLKISHDDGIIKVPYEKLPVNLQEQYGFDEGIAAAYRTESSQKQQEILKAVKSKIAAMKEKEAQEMQWAERDRKKSVMERRIKEATALAASRKPSFMEEKVIQDIGFEVKYSADPKIRAKQQELAGEIIRLKSIVSNGSAKSMQYRAMVGGQMVNQFNAGTVAAADMHQDQARDANQLLSQKQSELRALQGL